MALKFKSFQVVTGISHFNNTSDFQSAKIIQKQEKEKYPNEIVNIYGITARNSKFEIDEYVLAKM